MSAVNLAEVISKLCDYGMPEDVILVTLSQLNYRVEWFSDEDAHTAGFLRQITKGHGLSLGDRCCIALGMRLDLPVLTADRPWVRAPLQSVVNIQLIR